MKLLNLQSVRLSEAKEEWRFMLTKSAKDGNYPESTMKLSMV